MKIKKPLALGLVSGVALATFAVAAPAFADPVANSYAVVGSDTLQASMDALTNGTTVTGASVRVSAPTGTIGNFDAFAPGYSAAGGLIQTKSGGPSFPRPSGSGDGVNALLASINNTTFSQASGTSSQPIGGQVDIARSSAAPTTQVGTGILAWVPYGRDAVAYAYVGGSAADEANVAHLTGAQLGDIYGATSDQVISGTTVKAYLPQSGSGTRKFFMNAIGITSNVAGSAVYTNNNTLAENDASVFPTTVPSGTAYVVPFSAAAWISQANNAAPSTIPASGAVKLGTPLADPAFTTTDGVLAPNAAYYSNTTFGRDTYLVVERARITSGNAKYDATLANLLNPAKVSLVNMSSSATSPGGVKRAFGFLTPSSTTVLYSNTK